VKANTPAALDAICRKAMALRPEDRYPTALALAADVEHWLADEPVTAYREPWSVRTGRWLRRHRPLVAGAAALVLAAVPLSLVIAVNREQARRQAEADKREIAWQKDIAIANEQAATEREVETKAVLDFVENRIFAAARPEGQAGGLGRTVTLRRAVEAALPYVAQSFTNQPLIEARLRLTLGTSFWYLGDPKSAAEQCEAARALYVRHRGPDHPDTLRSMDSLANSYYYLGRHVDALKLREETLTLKKAKLGPEHPDTLGSMNNLSLSYYALGRHGDALRLREETLARMEAKLGPDHPDTLRSRNNLANSYYAVGRYGDALKLHEATLARMKAKLGPEHPDTLWSVWGLANCYTALGRHAEALKFYEETLALRKAKLGPDHPDTLTSMHSLALSYAALSQHADALKLHEETLALRKAKLGLDHPDTLYSMWSVAQSLVKLDRGAEAVPIIDDCVQRATGKVVHPAVLRGVLDLRLRHFERMEDMAGCRQTAAMWEKLHRADAQSLYTAACMRAVPAAVLRAADSTPVGAKQADAEAEQAMAWLKQTVAAGYKDAAHMEKDKDLDALRDREDFKKLLAELFGGSVKQK
jgi:tetratricopeptide (TPR) repeat protein